MIRDSEELALADWLGSAAFDRAEDYWPRRWAEAYVHFAAGEQRSWLHGLGMRWFPLIQWAERGGYPTPGHGNSVPRFHITWGTGPAVVEPFARERAELTTRADPVSAPGHVAGGRRFRRTRVGADSGADRRAAWRPDIANRGW